ncbi:MAG TPA: tetratricopeptide repeat protein, partial [Verrucomicrobiales bacterium]|nr:tetratricopeptide repeat protein [Verrucomicrobiales bacterium]
NRLTEAEPLMQRALKIDEASFGPKHPNVAIRLGNLAALLYATNRFTEAEPLMQRALKIDEANFGPEHPDVAIRLNNLAQLLQATNRLTEAQALTQRMVSIFFVFQVRTGHRHPHIVVAVKNYLLLARELKLFDPDIHTRLDKLRQDTGLEAAAFATIWQEVLAANPR